MLLSLAPGQVESESTELLSDHRELLLLPIVLPPVDLLLLLLAKEKSACGSVDVDEVMVSCPCTLATGSNRVIHTFRQSWHVVALDCSRCRPGPVSLPSTSSPTASQLPSPKGSDSQELPGLLEPTEGLAFASGRRARSHLPEVEDGKTRVCI